MNVKPGAVVAGKAMFEKPLSSIAKFKVRVKAMSEIKEK